MGGAERNDCLSRKVIAFKKRTDNARGLPMPDRISENYRIIVGHIVNTSGYFGANQGIVLLAVGASVCIIRKIGFGVRLDRDYLVNVRGKNIRSIFGKCFGCIGT